MAESDAAGEALRIGVELRSDMSGCIVCGVDGSRQGGHAAELAARLARDLGARSLLVHVQEERPTRSALRMPRPIRTRRRRKLLKRVADECCFPPDTRLRLREGDPTTELLEAARQEDAELLVVSTGGAATASPVLLGGTTGALIRSCPCPVVIVPSRSVAPLDADSMRTVVCALEGRVSDPAVLGLAADLAARLGGGLHVVTAGDEPTESTGMELSVHRAGPQLEETVTQVAGHHRAGLAVAGPPDYNDPGSELNIPLAVELAATGEVPVVVLPPEAELYAGSGHYELTTSIA
jgi:nucleotide-binding universal stress UspA family protein